MMMLFTGSKYLKYISCITIMHNGRVADRPQRTTAGADPGKDEVLWPVATPCMGAVMACIRALEAQEVLGGAGGAKEGGGKQRPCITRRWTHAFLCLGWLDVY
jgi:hypothetical protein